MLFTHPVFWIGFIICFINNFVLELLKEPIKFDNNDGGNHNNQVNQEIQKKLQIIDILRYVLFIIVILLFVSFAFTTVIPKGAAKTDEDNQKTVVSEEKDNNTENEESKNEKVVIKEEKTDVKKEEPEDSIQEAIEDEENKILRDIIVWFEHSIVDSSYRNWMVQLIDGVSDGNLLRMDVRGDEGVVFATAENVMPGTYYLKVTPFNNNNMDYWILVQ